MKKLKLFLFAIIPALLFSSNVKALSSNYESGYYGDVSYVNMGDFYWANGSFPLYGVNGSGNGIPKIANFYNGSLSLFYVDGNYDVNNGLGNYAFNFKLKNELISGQTYDISVKLVGSQLSTYFNGVSSVRNANVSNNVLLCPTSTNCSLQFTITMTSTTSTLYFDINKGSSGLNSHLFNQYVDELYFPQIKIQGSTDLSGVESRQDTIIDNQDKINQTNKGILSKISSIFDWLTNTDSANLDSANNIAGFLPAGPIDSIINLPLTFLKQISTNLSKTCTPLDVKMPYVNKNVQIPCLNTIFNQIAGLPNFWNWVGTIASVIIIYRYLIAFYKYYDDLTTLKANIMADWGEI